MSIHTQISVVHQPQSSWKGMPCPLLYQHDAKCRDIKTDPHAQQTTALDREIGFGNSS